MTQARNLLREGQALLEREIITLVRQGKTMNTEDRVFGYTIDPADDIMHEVEVGSLAIIDDTLHVFLHWPEEEYTEEEAREYLRKESRTFLPAWFALDEGFYGLRLPTMMNIAEALD